MRQPAGYPGLPSLSRLFKFLALPALALYIACTSDTGIGPGSPTTIRITPASASIVLGQQKGLKAYVLDNTNASIASTIELSWSSSDPSVATVGDTGVVTAVALGTATITASYKGLSQTADITVTPAPAIAVSPDTVRFSAVAGGASPAAGTGNVTNSGGSTLDQLSVGTVTYGPGATNWISAQLDQTTAPAVLTISPNTSAIGVAGTYTATIPVQSSSALVANSPQVVIARLDVAAGAPTQIAVSAGSGQTATVNTSVPVVPTVIVRDALNNPVPNVTVSFAVTAGGGSVTAASAVTGSDGVASSGGWKLGTAAGTNTLTASFAGGGGPVSTTINATGTPGPATTLAATAGDGQSVSVGTAVATLPQVRATDTFGNGVSGVAITFAVASGGGSATGTSQVTDAAGLATVGGWTLGTTAGTNTLTATATSATLNGSPVTFTATGVPGSPASIVKQGGDAQSGVVGTTLPTQYSVLVTDASSNPIPGLTVGWAVAGGGSITASSTTNASGIAVATRTLGTVAGTQTATASVSGLSTGFTATATPGPVSSSVSTLTASSPITASSGSSASAVAVTVKDAFGNAISGASVVVAISGSGNAINQPAVTNGSGATSGSFSSTVAQTKTVSVTANGTAITQTANVVVNAATATALQVATAPGGTIKSGSPFGVQPVIRVIDQFGNVATPPGGSTVTASRTAGTGRLDGTLTVGVTGSTYNFGNLAIGDSLLGTGSHTLTYASSTGLTATSSNISVAISFSYNLNTAIFNNGNAVTGRGACTGCHSSGFPPGFDPTASITYSAIVNVASQALGSCPGKTYIVPSSTANSLIYQKVANFPNIAACGVQMPQGGPYLTATELNLIAGWINAGAPNN